MLQLMYDLCFRSFHDCQFQVEIAVNSFPEAWLKPVLGRAGLCWGAIVICDCGWLLTWDLVSFRGCSNGGLPQENVSIMGGQQTVMGTIFTFIVY